MRNPLVIVVAMLLALLWCWPAYAAPPKRAEAGLKMLGRLIHALAERIGDRVGGDAIEGANEIAPVEVEGEGNTVLQIEALSINVNMGDLIREEHSEEYEEGGAEELVFHLMEMLGHHPEMPMPPPMWEPAMPAPVQPEIMEMFMQLPPDIDPGFMAFMFELGKLAWEHPQFREHLEHTMLEMHQRLAQEQH